MTFVQRNPEVTTEKKQKVNVHIYQGGTYSYRQMVIHGNHK